MSSWIKSGLVLERLGRTLTEKVSPLYPHPTMDGQCCCLDGSALLCAFPSIILAVLSEGLCVLCVLQLGSVACSPVDCPITCTYPFHPDGECCPVCHGEWEKPSVSKSPRWTGFHRPVSVSVDCNFEGRKVVNGQVFTLDDEPCTRCICQVSWPEGLGLPARPACHTWDPELI